MNKELKEKLIKHSEKMQGAFPSLYSQRWVEKAADEGWKDVVDSLEESQPGFKKVMHEKAGNIFEVVYYSAFEKALNTFFVQCLDDTITNCELCLNDLHKITAEIKKKGVELKNRNDNEK